MKARIILIAACAIAVYLPLESTAQCAGGCGRGQAGMSMQNQQGKPGQGMGYGKGAQRGAATQSEVFRCDEVLAEFPKEALSDAEYQSLVRMREEEKLARDVYTVLYRKWKLPIFNNILTSENRHMEAMACLLARYNLPDPVSKQKEGIFTNKDLQKAYDVLVREGSANVDAALRTGAYIEDLDIFDLEAALKVADNADIQAVYRDLAAASGNHIRAFSRQLAQRGVSYMPKMLTQEAYDAVLATAHQRCDRLHP